MIQTHTFTGTEAQQIIQKLQSITASQHFIQYEINGTSVVASPNQQYRNDKIGQIEGCLKFFVDCNIFCDPIMGTFKQYQEQLVKSYKVCQQLYKYWNDNIDSIIENEEQIIKTARMDLEKAQTIEQEYIRNFENDQTNYQIAQAFIDKDMAKKLFNTHKQSQMEFSRLKSQGIYGIQYGTNNLNLLKEQKKELVNKFRIDLLTLKQQYDQYSVQMRQLDVLINDINLKLEPIFQGQQNSQLKGLLYANANQIVNLYNSVAALYIMTTKFIQIIKWKPYLIENNNKVKAIMIEIEVAETELPFLKAELHQINQLIFGERLEYGRRKMEDVSVHIQQNLQIINANTKKLKDGFRQINLQYNTRTQQGVISVYNSNVTFGSITYVNSITLTKQVPGLVEFNPYAVVFTEETLKQKVVVKDLKDQAKKLEGLMNERQRLEMELQQINQEPGELTQANLDDLTWKNETIETTQQVYNLLVQAMQIQDVHQLKITQITALFGIILRHLNVEKETCCSSTYNITKYTEINKSFADIVFAKAIREVKNQPNSMCITHSARITQTESVQLLDTAKLITQFELFGAYQTSTQDRQVIRMSIREMDIDQTLFQITIKIAQLFVQEYRISIKSSTLDSNTFIQSYKLHFHRPLQQVTPQQVQQA